MHIYSMVWCPEARRASPCTATFQTTTIGYWYEGSCYNLRVLEMTFSVPNLVVKDADGVQLIS